MTRNSKKLAKPSRLSREMAETAKGMHALGIMDDAGYAKITMRQVSNAEAPATEPLTGEDKRAMETPCAQDAN